MFEELNLSDETLRAINDLGFTEPTDIQCVCIPLISEGLDLVGRSKTGSGKTLAFGIPLIERAEQNKMNAVVLCPTRELAMQVAEEIGRAAKYRPDFKIVTVYGGADMGKQIRSLKNASLVVATPGRLIDHIKRKSVKLDTVNTIVLDEADEMLDMGFREDIEYILKQTPKSRQTVMFSATIPPAIRSLTQRYMKNPEFAEIGESNVAIEQISQSYITCGRDKKERLVRLFNDYNIESAIVFTNTKRMAEAVNIHLSQQGINSRALHGDMRQSERKRVMADVKAHKVAVLVATDVAARGIDINDIQYVINYDLPQDVESYIHRIGRTGRAGKDGIAVTLINEREEFDRLNIYKIRTKSDIKCHTLSINADMFAPKPYKPPFSPRSRSGRISTRRR